MSHLEKLETLFVGLSESEATNAYADSLSAVAHVLRLRGNAGLRQLVDALADGRPAAEALPAALSLSYSEFQRDWEQYLLRAEAPRAATR